MDHKMAVLDCGVGGVQSLSHLLESLTTNTLSLGQSSPALWFDNDNGVQEARGMLVAQSTGQRKSYTFVNLNTAHVICLVIPIFIYILIFQQQ